MMYCIDNSKMAPHSSPPLLVDYDSYMSTYATA